MNLRRHFFVLFSLAVLLPGLPLTFADETAPELVEELRKLETLQGAEARKMGKVAGDVARLLEDLESNGLLEKAGGKKVGKFQEVIHAVAETQLPAVANHLRDARLESDARRHHIKSADEEMDAIVTELGKVLAGSSSMLAAEALVEELKDMIKVQTLVRGKTAEWGKSMLISPETSGAGKGPLMQDQTTILTRHQKFLEELRKAADEATDEATKSRFQQAGQVLNPTQIANPTLQEKLGSAPTTHDVLQAAINQVDGGDVLAAVGAQDGVIASFKSALQIISSGQFELADFVAGLEKLIQKQKILMTETGAEQELANKIAFYEARQTEIRDEVSKASFEAPDLFVSKGGEYLVEPLIVSLGEAIEAITATEKETAVAAQQKVIVLLEAVYGTANSASDQGSEGGLAAMSPEIPEEMYKLPPDGESEDMPLVDSDLPELFESGVSYELGLMPEGTTEGAAPGATAMAANRFIGLEESDSEKKGTADEGAPAVGQDKNPSGAGGTGQGNTNTVKKDRIAKDSMQRQQQKAKQQEYVRQLPPEFRRQVADYYELIAE